ncbi:MAG: VIT1/CCC1 transporter family protein [Sulfolobaceae archaeon]
MQKSSINEIIRHSYKDELIGFMLYEALTKVEKDAEIRNVLKRLSDIERSHSEFWRRMAESHKIELEKLDPFDRLKLNFFILIRKIFGTRLVIKLLEREEIKDVQKYKNLLAHQEISEEEKKELEKILIDEVVHEEMLSLTESRSKDIGDFVYGISDGLIEVLAAVSGLAGILLNPLLVAIGGIIVGIAGTLSMTIGSYLSTESEVEINRARRKKIEAQKEIDSSLVIESLKRNLQAFGIKSKDVEIVAKKLYDVAEDIIAPKSSESPTKSAGITGISYIIGAIIPVIPFLIGLPGITGLLISYAVTGLFTFIIGYIIGILSESNPVKKGLKMSVLAIAAALTTHTIGTIASNYLSVPVS